MFIIAQLLRDPLPQAIMELKRQLVDYAKVAAHPPWRFLAVDKLTALLRPRPSKELQQVYQKLF
jgi:hypothetical protein